MNSAWHLRANEDLSKRAWLGVGGACDWFAEPNDLASLRSLLVDFDHRGKIFILGAGSNLLVRDGGVRGLVIKLGKMWDYVKLDEEEVNVLEVGGATPLMRVSKFAMAHGLSGLEFMIGIPGLAGGGVRMNAGCFGGETVDCLVSVDVIDFDGGCRRLQTSDLDFSYRESGLGSDSIVLSARFRLAAGSVAQVTATTKEILAQRKLRQPQGVRTGGSTFRNPLGMKAWELVAGVGGRGLQKGGAKFSEQHCNFLLNCGDAKASDLESLAEQVRKRVRAARGVDLVWEIVRWGDE